MTANGRCGYPAGVHEEWRVQADVGPDYPPYDFTWCDEAQMRGFLSLVSNPGFHRVASNVRITRRWVTVTEWTDVEVPEVPEDPPQTGPA